MPAPFLFIVIQQVSIHSNCFFYSSRKSIYFFLYHVLDIPLYLSFNLSATSTRSVLCLVNHINNRQLSTAIKEHHFRIGTSSGFNLNSVKLLNEKPMKKSFRRCQLSNVEQSAHCLVQCLHREATSWNQVSTGRNGLSAHKLHPFIPREVLHLRKANVCR